MCTGAEGWKAGQGEAGQQGPVHHQDVPARGLGDLGGAQPPVRRLVHFLERQHFRYALLKRSAVHRTLRSELTNGRVRMRLGVIQRTHVL